VRLPCRLDSERIVIGEVLQGDELLAELNRVPARASGGIQENGLRAVAKAGGDVRARVEQAYRPLLKIKIVDSSLL